MATRTELERIAAQATALRPDWPTRSVLTYLECEHAAKSYRDLAVAVAHIATDAETRTPRRLSEPGPWWRPTDDPAPAVHFARCPEVGHESFPAHNCSACRSEALEGTATAAPATHAEVPKERIREILKQGARA